MVATTVITMLNTGSSLNGLQMPDSSLIPEPEPEPEPGLGTLVGIPCTFDNPTPCGDS